jgi:hypothetical protein
MNAVHNDRDRFSRLDLCPRSNPPLNLTELRHSAWAWQVICLEECSKADSFTKNPSVNLFE